MKDEVALTSGLHKCQAHDILEEVLISVILYILYVHITLSISLVVWRTGRKYSAIEYEGAGGEVGSRNGGFFLP